MEKLFEDDYTKIEFSFKKEDNVLNIKANSGYSDIDFDMNKENLIELKTYLEKVLKIMASNV